MNVVKNTSNRSISYAISIKILHRFSSFKKENVLNFVSFCLHFIKIRSNFISVIVICAKVVGKYVNSSFRKQKITSSLLTFLVDFPLFSPEREKHMIYTVTIFFWQSSSICSHDGLYVQ